MIYMQIAFTDIQGDENIVSQKYNQLAADNVDISRSPVQIG